MTRRRVKPTIPPAPRPPLIEVVGDPNETVRILNERVNVLTQHVTRLNREIRLQRKVYLQTMSLLGYDMDRLRVLDRKIREEIGDV